MNRIREILDMKGLSQKDLAIKLGMDESTLSKIINGKKEVNLRTARRISKALGWGIDYIWPPD